ncbi:MAG TPA: heat-inducible transcriptional repressor HrcA [Anaerolineales bacterium]|nr:heat-inducible transcriptional repressor HrcA [Anaerolineales bacterium]
MEELTERQETILALIIHEYVETGEPIGSMTLLGRYGLGVSSATIRNEMSALTHAGLLRQLHTSGGRTPTEEGYRYFVRRLLTETELPSDEKRLISHQFYQARADVDEWVRLAASVLAHHSRAASLVTAPHSSRAVFKHLELIGTQGRQVLMVIVLQGGDVRQQMLTLAEAFSQEVLSQTAAHITAACAGRDADGVAAEAGPFSELGRELIRLITEVMRRADAVSSGDLHHDGLSNVLAHPEFAQSDTARQALRLLEERSFLDEVLAKALSPGIGSVQVVIGGEGAWEELRDCSMVLARYGAAGYATGALGVLGPTRMAYGRTISAVRYVAGLMSDLMVEAYAG